jgi:hypothetical protein
MAGPLRLLHLLELSFNLRPNLFYMFSLSTFEPSVVLSRLARTSFRSHYLSLFCCPFGHGPSLFTDLLVSSFSYTLEHAFLLGPPLVGFVNAGKSANS